MQPPSRYVSARTAAEMLHVNLATIYAYVSRGLLRSEAEADGQRARRYLAEDVQKLIDQKRFRRDPAEAAAGAMQWGAPVLESALTHITDAGLAYRGQDAVALATSARVEEVAALLWTGDMARADEIFASPPQQIADAVLPHIPPDLAPLARVQVALALATAHDLAAYDLDLRFNGVIQTGARIVKLMAAVIAAQPDVAPTIARIVQSGWCPAHPASAELLSAALILCADHELNTSAFAARVVASAEAHLYLVVTAGLAALQGFKHGGNTGLVEAFLHEVGTPAAAPRVVANRLRRGVCIPGFGHRLYPHGDPRGAALLRLAQSAYGATPAFQRAQAVADAVREVTGKLPTLEFGLVALMQSLGVPDGSALALFALGRSLGIIGHAIEHYRTGQIIRPRAKYVGP
jgi:citrate synthase